MIDVRDGVKRAIEASGMKSNYVARRMNWSEQQLSDMVNKRRKLDANELFEICNILGKTPTEIFSLSLKV